MNTQETIELISRVLTGEASEDENAKLQSWRQLSPDNERLYRDHQRIWDKAIAPASTIDTDAAWEKFASRLNDAKKVNPLYAYLRIAAAIIFIGGGALLISRMLMNPAWEEVQTASNETRQVTLPDGSVVWLNHDSKLEYEAEFKDTRSIKLNGEAFFEVVKDPSKPFVITTTLSVTKVLGTSFNLSAYDADGKVALSVTSGKVSFTSRVNGFETIVPAGHSALIDSGGNNIAGGLADVNAAAWKMNRLVFNDTPLSEVFRSMEHYFKVKIDVAHPGINACHFTGEFDKPELVSMMNALCRTLQLQWSGNTKHITVKGKGCD